jgi:hypothetical protein
MNPTAENILNNVVGWSNEITEDVAIDFTNEYCEENNLKLKQ